MTTTEDVLELENVEYLCRTYLQPADLSGLVEYGHDHDVAIAAMQSACPIRVLIRSDTCLLAATCWVVRIKDCTIGTRSVAKLYLSEVRGTTVVIEDEEDEDDD